MTEPSIYHCEDCEWTGTPDDMDLISNITERVMMGELHPAGQCPECGSLQGVLNADVPEYAIESVAEIMVQRGWVLRAPDGTAYPPATT